MSIANLLVDNNYDIFANSINIKNPTPTCFSASSNAPQAYPNGQFPATKINFNTSIIATPNYNNSTSTYTVPKSGVYFILGRSGFLYNISSNLPVQASITIRVNNNIVRTGVKSVNSISGFNRTELIAEFLGNLNQGDQVQVWMEQPAGTGAPNITNPQSPQEDTYFFGFLLK